MANATASWALSRVIQPFFAPDPAVAARAAALVDAADGVAASAWPAEKRLPLVSPSSSSCVLAVPWPLTPLRSHASHPCPSARRPCLRGRLRSGFFECEALRVLGGAVELSRVLAMSGVLG